MRLTLGCAAVSLLILLTTFWTLSRAARVAVAEESRRHAEDIARYFADAIAEPVAASDDLQIHVLARSLLDNGVKELRIVASDGEVLFPASTKGLASSTVSPKSSDSVRVNQAVSFAGRLVGRVTLWLDRGGLERRITAANAFFYPVLAFGLLSMLLLGFTALHSPFRVLSRMRSVAERIGSGDLSVRVPAQGNDEMAAFCRTFNRMVERLDRARGELQRQHVRTIEAMIRTVEAKDSYTQGHCLRVRGYVREILGRYGDVSTDERGRIETAALLHDVGKIGIPDAVLLKNGDLTSEEIEIIKSHVTIGEKILLELNSMNEVAHWVRHHHERWDGGGYPDALRGVAIPFASRVITVADCIDAMLTNRPYRTPRTPDLVLRVLQEECGRQFDPRIVECALPIVEAKIAAQSAPAARS